VSVPLVTEIRLPTVAIIFNERSGPDQVAEIIARQHAFTEFETYEVADEIGRPAYLLLAYCETGTANELFDMIGHRLPDYIQARKFPPSRVEDVRRAAAHAAEAQAQAEPGTGQDR
jgi:hypothetical protein